MPCCGPEGGLCVQCRLSGGPPALYLGIADGSPPTRSNRDTLSFRFRLGGEERSYAIANPTGNYCVQNRLAEGARYHLIVKGGMICRAEEARPTAEGRLEAVTGRTVTLDGRLIPVSARVRVERISLRPGGAQASPERAEPGEWARLYGIPVTQIDLYPFQPLDAVGIAYRPGLRTLKNLLSAALCPVGRTLYVYGGGWNWQDDGASCQAVSAGVPECWGRFFQSQGTDYTYRDDSHPGQSWYPCGGVNRYYYAGADCSGYLGWVIYQVMHSRSGGPGYVVPSTGMARHLAEHLGLGTWCHRGKAGEFRPGDIFSMSGHVWMCLGPCGDGSLVILHSMPSLSRTGCPGGGVQLSGVGKRPDCQAAVLARRYMTAFYPDWTRRYEPTWKPVKEYTALAGADTGRFSWYLGPNGLADPEGCAHRGAEELLADLYGR